MRDWLDHALTEFSLTEEAEGYLLGRGVTEERIRDLGVVLWESSRVGSAAPDPSFCDHKSGHGPKGERLRGYLCTPIRNPRGRLLGFEARAWGGTKRVMQYLLPDAKWNPVFIGLTPATMRKVWDGANVWIGEGLFDMGAIEHVIPSTDVAFATLRARVSQEHAQFLRRFCSGCVNMVYDNDETGRKQTFGYVDPATGKRRWGAIDTLSRVGVRVRDIPYRGGKDPGEVWDKGGVAGLRLAFAGNL